MSDMAEAKKQMEKVLEHLKTEFSRMRVGRATASMVDGVRVDAYGNSMSLKEVAALAIPDAKTITISPWDRGLMGDIEKGILAANLGLTPINDGKVIRINLPPLTEERRKDFAKQMKKEGEDSKVAIRNIRRDTLEHMKKQQLTEDQQRKNQDEVQKMTDHFIQEVDKLVETKSKEVMTL